MFEQLPIDERNKELLGKAILKNRVSHCYIFVGPEGTEKKTIALEFAKAILCTGDVKPCDRCISCNKINHQNHPDFIDILPQDNSIKINQLREMQRKMNIKAYESDYKVFIINHSETMGIPAQNSLLKSLEEPSKGVVIILLSTTMHSILPTILSRGQILHFNPLDKETFEEEIKKLTLLGPEDMEDLYNLSQGCIGKGKYMLNHPEEIQLFKEFKNSIFAIIKGDYHKVFAFSKWVKESKLPNETVVNYLLMLFKNILQGMLTAKGDEYKELSDCLTYESIHDIIQEIVELQSTLKYNVNFQLQLEKLLLKLQEEK